MTPEDKKFYAGFETVVDKVSVMVQINRITDEMNRKLENDYGKIIPLQTPEQLIERFTEAVRIVETKDTIKEGV